MIADNTIYLAQLIAPAMIAIGIGILTHQEFYIKTFKHLKEETLAMYIGGIVAMVVGTAILLNHNSWDNLASALITLIGVGALLKGAILSTLPRLLESSFSKLITPSILPLVGSVYLIVGLYLGWVGYIN
ncbi:MAG: hypothetical protein R3B41_00590 [Candidatus Doudnabacteria bacterium]